MDNHIIEKNENELKIAGKIKNLHNEETVSIFKEKPLLIGRNVVTKGGNIRIELPEISRQHCQLFQENNKLFVEDLKSKNGVKVNGNRIEGIKQLLDGDIVEIAHLKFQIEVFNEHKKIYIQNGIYASHETIGDIKTVCVEVENPEDVIVFQRKMLENNPIKGALSLSYLENELKGRIYYNREGKDNLLHYLETQQEIDKWGRKWNSKSQGIL